MAWIHGQQQQNQMNTNMNMNYPQNQLQDQSQNQSQNLASPMNMNPQPMNPNMNSNPQQQFNPQQRQFHPQQPFNPQSQMQSQFAMYPPYPMNTSPSMHNQSYPMQPFNNSTPFQPYYGLQPMQSMQSQQMISPFQQQRNINNSNTQPLPSLPQQQQQFNFNSNTPINSNNNNNLMSQTQPLHAPQSPKQIIENEPMPSEQKYENEMIDDGQPKPRLEYSKMSLLKPKQLWILNGKDKIDENTQLSEENKIFGDLQTVYTEMKQNNSDNITIEGNTQKQNCRLLLEHKSKIEKQKPIKESDTKLTLQSLLVYEHNIRPTYEPFNEYKTHNLLRVPHFTSYPMSNSPITVTLHIYSVQFKDLPQFTVEDYLTQQIIFEHKIYTKCLENNESFSTQITLLRTRIEHSLAQNNRTKSANNINENNLLCVQLLDELISIRQKKDELQLQIQQLFTKLYMDWRNLVSWRYNHGMYKFANYSSLISSKSSENTVIYQGTKLILYLKKMEPNKIKQQIAYKQAMMDELYEIKNLISLKNIINKESRMEETFNEKIVRENIIQRQNTYLLKPGTVYYIAFIDTDTCDISQTDLCNTIERFRRRQLANYSINANVKVNNYDNTQIKSTKITNTKKIYTEFPSFTCDLQFELEMKLLKEPQSIDIELKSNSWFSSNAIANINVEINTNLIKEKSGELMKYDTEFESEMRISANRYLTNEDYKTYIYPTQNDEWNRKICGNMSYALQINITNEYKRKLFQKPQDTNEIMSVNVISDKDVIDSKEEQSADEQPMIKEKEMNNELLLIDTDSDTEYGSFRQKILKLRQRYAISSDEYIPLFDRDIPNHLYKAVYDETKQEIAFRNEMILDRINNATIHVSEVVRENKINFFSCFAVLISSIFKPKRKLRPKKSNYFVSSKASINPEKCKIILQILQCRNLPIRQHSMANNINNHSMGCMNIVQPFIEVSFMGNKCRTFTSFGVNARWEQTLYIEFTPPGNHKYTPSNLQKINEDIEISIYDELIVSVQNDNRKLNSQIQRKEKRYLGTVKIPFITCYFNKNIEGFLKLDSPLILLGYTKNVLNEPTLLSLFVTLDPPISNPHQQFNENIYFQWILNQDKENSENNPDFCLYCIDWMKSANYYNNNRIIEIFCSNSRNEPQLVCRYLRAIEPPMQVLPEIFVRFVSCIPYKEDIHLIPGARDVWMANTDFLRIGSGDSEEHTNLLACYFLWFDNQNQITNNGWSTYIVVGKSISNGDNTMYVLRRNSILKHGGNISIQNIILYDASQGISYNIPEYSGNNGGIPLCNLIDISIVYNSHQIYANLQSPNVHPLSELFSYEFENKQFWKPLFLDSNKNNKFESETYCLPSLQEPILEYVSLSNEYYLKRQNKLEYIIEKQFDSWRDLPTKWNYAICKILREILVGLEPLCQTGGHIPIINNQNPQIYAINQIFSKMYGFPLNVKDNGSENLLLENDENNAVSLVYNTKVHENDDPNVEFARAVYIYPYTNKIASVWIYIASLSKK